MEASLGLQGAGSWEWSGRKLVRSLASMVKFSVQDENCVVVVAWNRQANLDSDAIEGQQSIGRVGGAAGPGFDVGARDARSSVQ